MSRFFVALTTLGFVASAVLHLITFTRWSPPAGDALALALFAGAFVPLIAMVVRHRGAARARPDRRALGWREAIALVPGGARMLIVGAVLYALMNMVLSLMVTGGATAERVGDRHYLVEGGRRVEISREAYEEHRRVTMRLLSGHLLLFYLLPLAYFRFVDPHRREAVASLTPPDGFE